jgi:histidinol-phosphate/aromatic aminotransferase/cobyric acid decarboxylase-like protein
MNFKALVTVYSYRHPETRGVINRLLKKGFPHSAFLRATEMPGGLDDFHQPIIGKVLHFYQAEVPALSGFPNRYPTAGSEEGIREVMTQLKTAGVEQIYMLRGDYEGYREVAKQRGMRTIEVDPNTDLVDLPIGYWFISNPSAIDGNVLPNWLIDRILGLGHKLFYDLAYLGSAPPHHFDLSHPNIFAAVISMSKTYGLFYDRIGFTFSRQPIESLYGNKWFKSIFALMIAEAVVTDLRPGELYCKYRAIQEQIIADLNHEFGLGMRPSDAFLLGHLTAEDAAKLDENQSALIARFKRGDGYRFCLTPYFVERDPEAMALLKA